MTDKNAGDACGGDVGKNKLPLRSLSWVKKEPFLVPTEEIGAMIALAGGLLAGGAEDSEIFYGHRRGSIKDEG